MDAIIIKEVLEKLLGPITPVGESNSDEQRYYNLENAIAVTEFLLGKICTISICNKSEYYSISRAGKTAMESLANFKELIENYES